MPSSIGQDNSEVNADCSPLSRGSVNQSCREQDGQVCETETSEHEVGRHTGENEKESLGKGMVATCSRSWVGWSGVSWGD